MSDCAEELVGAVRNVVQKHRRERAARRQSACTGDALTRQHHERAEQHASMMMDCAIEELADLVERVPTRHIGAVRRRFTHEHRIDQV